MRVAVLGAGMQGCCVALELAARGIQVDLYDKNARPLTQASLNNEAKIHLGFLYGNDPSLHTARVLAKGALTFAPLLRRWIGADVDRVPVSETYHYVVHRDSILSVEAVTNHLRACSTILNEEPDVADDAYFGVDFRRPPTPVTSVDHLFNPALVTAAFETPEVGISAEFLAGYVRSHVLAAAEISFVAGATIEDVAMEARGCEVGFNVGGSAFRQTYDHVVNALWVGRLAVDATAGITPGRPWLFRLKYMVHLPVVLAERQVPSVSMVLGPFGDVVRYGNGEAYLSWYPVGLTARSADLTPPDWPNFLAGEEAAEMQRSVFEALREVVPGLSRLAPLLPQAEVRGGVIFAWGESDIDDPTSPLHTRDEIGPMSYGRYHSINTGKLTMAPMFALLIASRICRD